MTALLLSALALSHKLFVAPFLAGIRLACIWVVQLCFEGMYLAVRFWACAPRPQVTELLGTADYAETCYLFSNMLRLVWKRCGCNVMLPRQLDIPNISSRISLTFDNRILVLVFRCLLFFQLRMLQGWHSQRVKQMMQWKQGTESKEQLSLAALFPAAATKQELTVNRLVRRPLLNLLRTFFWGWTWWLNSASGLLQECHANARFCSVVPFARHPMNNPHQDPNIQLEDLRQHPRRRFRQGFSGPGSPLSFQMLQRRVREHIILVQGGPSSVRLRFVHRTVRTVPVHFSDGSSGERFLCRSGLRFVSYGCSGESSLSVYDLSLLNRWACCKQVVVKKGEASTLDCW